MTKKRQYTKQPKETPLQKITNLINDPYCASSYANVDYNTKHCTEGGHSYCSCSTIANARVTNIDITGFASECARLTDNPIDAYCIDRVLHINYKIKDINNWQPDIRGGYYGEECHGAKLSNTVRDKLIFDITCVLAHHSTRDKIFAVLELEYGYLADIIKNTKDFEIVNIEKEQLIIPNQDYARRLNTDLVNEYADHKLPIGVYMSVGKDEQFRVVDGYHRSTSFMRSIRKTADILVTRF